jgi:hypothetical protein
VRAALAALALTVLRPLPRLNAVAISLATATLVVAVVRMGVAFVANARMLAAAAARR